MATSPYFLSRIATNVTIFKAGNQRQTLMVPLFSQDKVWVIESTPPPDPIGLSSFRSTARGRWPGRACAFLSWVLCPCASLFSQAGPRSATHCSSTFQIIPPRNHSGMNGSFLECLIYAGSVI